VLFSGAVAQPNEAPHAGYFDVLSRLAPEIETCWCNHRVRLGQVCWKKVRDSRVRPGVGGGLSKHQALSYAAKCLYDETGDEVPQGR
jgi:hypothetical protein